MSMPRREPNQPLNSTPNAEAGPRRTSSPLPLGRQCFGFHLSQARLLLSRRTVARWLSFNPQAMRQLSRGDAPCEELG